MPAIWPYSRILVKKTDFGDLKAGDVICYDTDCGLHCHRIIAIAGDLYFTSGDSYPCVQPETVRDSDIIGRVEGIGIGPHWITYGSAEFRILTRISPKTGKAVRKIVKKVLIMPIISPIARRFIVNLKADE